MHVSGSITTPNYPLETDDTIDIPFNLPPGGSKASVDVNIRKVSLNGNIIPPLTAVVSIAPTTTPMFRVQNKGTDPWPPVSSLVVQCDYRTTVDELPDAVAALREVLEDHEVRIQALETA